MSWDSLQPPGRLLAGSRLPSFDGIRMVAVALVILSHAGYEDGPSDLGVNIFFVLSGFLITWLLPKEREKTGAISLKTFYRAPRLPAPAGVLRLHGRRPRPVPWPTHPGRDAD